jgi:hypothetical protein
VLIPIDAVGPVVSTVPSPVLENEACLLPEEEDECLAIEILLHIAYEVVSQLDNAEDFIQLSLEEHSLRYFLVEQIHSLQVVIEAQEDFVPPLAQDIVVVVDSTQDPWASQSDVASFGCCSGTLMRVVGQVDWGGPSSCSREVILSPLR